MGDVNDSWKMVGGGGDGDIDLADFAEMQRIIIVP